MKIGLKIEGLNQVLRNLDQFHPQKVDESVKAGVETGMKVVAQEAKGRAPVDTGQLRDAIETVVVSRDQVVTGGVVINNAPYWRHVEYGTSRMRAQPFLRPVMKRREDAAIQALVKTFRARFKL